MNIQFNPYLKKGPKTNISIHFQPSKSILIENHEDSLLPGHYPIFYYFCQSIF